jgi:hypothetical protein
MAFGFRVWADHLHDGKQLATCPTTRSEHYAHLTIISPRAVHDTSTPKFITLRRVKICIFMKTNTKNIFSRHSDDDKHFLRDSEIRFMRITHQTETVLTLWLHNAYAT